MGQKHSTQAKSNSASKPIDLTPQETMTEYELKKRRPGCTGMFWRADPTKQTSLESNNHWPRDGAKLKGKAIEHNGEKWLLCTAVKQKSDSDWKSAPGGAAMPFEYDNHYYLEVSK